MRSPTKNPIIIRLVNKTKWYLDNWRLSKVKFNTLNSMGKWDWKQSPARVYAAGFHQKPHSLKSFRKKQHALHNGANYVKLKLESQINWRSRFLSAHNVQWKLLNNATARCWLHLQCKQIYKLSEFALCRMVCFIALRSFKMQTHITIKLVARKQCNNVLHKVLSRRRRLTLI